MGFSYTETRYRINGLLATEDTVLDNLEKLCNAAGAWLTYDIHDGKWSVIINKTGTSQYSFDDSNIIGPISISGTGLDNLYNKVTVTFPHEDLRDQKDVISIEIPAEDRNDNEPDNTLNIVYDLVTDPVQAELLGLLELKQSRVDKVVTFRTDYSKIAVKAGDLIDITSTVYGFVNKMFRVVTVREIDTDEGGIDIEITGLEYDANVYNADDLARYTRSNENGIISIGAITAPDQPQVTIYSNIARPYMSISTQVNSGLSNAVEYWITDDVPPGTTVDSNRTYTLLTTEFSANGTVFTPGTEVRANVTYNNGDFLVKCRSRNDSAVSTFSTPSGVITYDPNQVTDVIGPNTEVRDETGNLATTAGLLALLQIADEFFGGNAAVGPGGGSGSGSTFLLLEIQNFNTNSTTGGETIHSGSKFVPVVRVIPPGVPSVEEGIDQVALSQCIIGDQTLNGQYLDPLTAFPPGSSTAVSIGPSNWPQYYPHKILQLCVADSDVNPNVGATYIYYGVDLNVFRYYYPDATNCQIEIRGYWQLEDQVRQYQYYDSSPTPITTISNTVWKTTTVGTNPIRANAYVWTGANIAALSASGNPPFITGNLDYSTRGIGTSANAYVTSSVYPPSLGSNVALLSVGDHITTFKYDFTKPAYQAPSFNTFNLATPPATTINIPTAWTVGKSGNTITNVSVASNVTVTTIPKGIGTVEIQDSVSGPMGGPYLHNVNKITKVNGTAISNFNRGAGVNPYQIYFADIDLAPLTANVFQYAYVESQSSFYEGPNIAVTSDTGIQEWWNIVAGNFGSFEIGGSNGQVYDETYANTYSSVRRLYSNMAKINTTSTSYVARNYVQKKQNLSNEVYIPKQWGQLKANANISSYNQTDFNFTGTIGAGQWWDRFGTDNFPYIEPTFANANYDVGFFYNEGNVEINHLQIGGNINANANVDAGFGIWVTSV